MNLKTVTLLVAVLGALSLCANLYQFVDFLARSQLKDNISAVVTWPIHILWNAGFTLFLFVLFFRQKSKA